MSNKVSRKIITTIMSVFAIGSPSIVSANINVDMLEPRGVIVAIDHVQLIAHDGSATITGKFLSYDDGFYNIETPLGALQVAEKWVRCEGALCPHTDKAAFHLDQAKVN